MKAHGLPGTHGRFFAKVHTICAMSVIAHHVKSHALPTVAHAHAQGFLMVADKKVSLSKNALLRADSGIAGVPMLPHEASELV